MAPRHQRNNSEAFGVAQVQMQDSGASFSRGSGGPVSPLEDLMRRKGVDEAWDALDKMQHTGLPTDRFTVSRMLMRTLADARRYWDPAKIHRSVALVDRFLQKQPEEADEVLFNALLDTHCRMKDLSGLQATLSRMRELNVEPSHVTLGILVKAYGQACDIKSVLRLWDEMSQQRQQANAVTYGCMINACVRCGQTEKAVEIFNEMKSLKKHCNTILYTTLVKGYGNEKDLHSALGLFREMREENVPYNTIAYNSIIDVCIKCSDVQSAEDIFREMLAPTSTVQPDLITYSTLLKGYCQVGNLDKALQVAETIKACGLKCDELVYNTLMDGCVKANDLSAGVGLFAEMMASGMRPSSITHSIFLRLYQRNGYKGNANDAVAQLYQHHGLDRPQSLDKPARVKAARGKVTHRGGGGGLEQPSMPQVATMPHPSMMGGCGQAGIPGMPPVPPLPDMMGPAPPGRHWPQQMQPPPPPPPPPGRVRDGYGGQPQFPPSGRGPSGQVQHDQHYGILSSPSTYGGVSMERPAAPPAYGGHHAMPHHRGPMPMEPPMAYGAMQRPMSYPPQGYVPGAAPTPYPSHGGFHQDHPESPFPSLLLQQRQLEEYPDPRRQVVAPVSRKQMQQMQQMAADSGY